MALVSSTCGPRWRSPPSAASTSRRGEAIGAHSGVMEELRLVGRGGVAHHALEGVPQDDVAARLLVHREVRLEHAAVDAEAVDAPADLVPPRRCQIGRCGWLFPLVPA